MIIANMGKQHENAPVNTGLLTYNDITNILAYDLGVVVPFLENMPAGSRQSGGPCENIRGRA